MNGILPLALAGVLAAFGCSSSATSDGGTGNDGGDGSVMLYGLSTGDSCFDIVSIKTGFNDGCMIGVDTLVGNTALLVNYVMSSATLTVGTNGSLGGGQIAFNMGTLLRDNTATDSSNAQCMWHQTDTSNVTVTATNKFDIAVTEVENMFTTACGTTAPAGGTCTSTWTWTVQKGTKTPPGCN